MLKNPVLPSEKDEADTIEITPEMIEAGVERLFDYDPAFSNERDIVAEIFKAMLGRMVPPA